MGVRQVFLAVLWVSSALLLTVSLLILAVGICRLETAHTTNRFNLVSRNVSGRCTIHKNICPGLVVDGVVTEARNCRGCNLIPFYGDCSTYALFRRAGPSLSTKRSQARLQTPPWNSRPTCLSRKNVFGRAARAVMFADPVCKRGGCSRRIRSRANSAETRTEETRHNSRCRRAEWSSPGLWQAVAVAAIPWPVHHGKDQCRTEGGGKLRMVGGWII